MRWLEFSINHANTDASSVAVRRKGSFKLTIPQRKSGCFWVKLIFGIERGPVQASANELHRKKGSIHARQVNTTLMIIL